ncbi:lipoprotein-releasing system ATP-binding protein LolD [Methanobrevibacter cuticularis]|uniref:Lipoprotein-releasing system ATP-binding protein LolD n=1 Tax=Methanobrevibacter cuticularis TaxID=47311 RepID=A0A166CS32_9EURY|nr:ABC transporter ATP-binding protein [Methanobrevibacter cuticularis]KZX14804.1 lipoprotein-releasing system ATP-binding protein LolD [Methanobrevibacter cuticularis]
MDEIISMNDVTKSYEKGNIKALNGVNIRIDEGDFVSIVGPSGSGKSTLLNMIGALDKPDRGHVKVAGQNLLENENLSKFRAEKIGFIFQLHNLIPTLSVRENVEIPMYSQKIDSKEMKKRSFELLDYMGLKNRANDNITKLSGGERQRVAIARALVNKPSIILADEPTGSLDSENGIKVLNILKKLHDDENVTLIMITHDQQIAKMANHIIKMKDGKIIS